MLHGDENVVLVHYLAGNSTARLQQAAQHAKSAEVPLLNPPQREMGAGREGSAAASKGDIFEGVQSRGTQQEEKSGGWKCSPRILPTPGDHTHGCVSDCNGGPDIPII